MIARSLPKAAEGRYDLAVVGGGIYGVGVTLEAARRGLRVLLLESGDFGSGASGNSLRILHGGLRYLQTADLVRFRESVAERRWFAHVYPDLVDPLPCLMPLYADGLKRRSVMRLALTANDWLSRNRNDGLSARVRLPAGGTVGVAETRAFFESVRAERLQGGAVWYDYQMRSSERILIEMLGWACGLGADAVNQAAALKLLTSNGGVSGLVVQDRLSGQRFEIRADRICNCTGSNGRAFAAALDRDHPDLFLPSLAFNVLFDCERLSSHALAVAAPDPGAPVYFLCPSAHGIWAGTEHVARPEACMTPDVAESEVAAFIGRINRAIPGARLTLQHVRRVFSGLLPVRTAGTTDLTAREAFVRHADRGGPRHLYSLTGMKFTTARKVAQRAVDMILGAPRSAAQTEDSAAVPPLSRATPMLIDGAAAAKMQAAAAVQMIREVAAAESVNSAEDFCLRRTNWIFTAPDFSRMLKLTEQALAASSAMPLDPVPVAS